MRKVAMCIVHHANQLIISNGYDNRDGISKVARGYLDVLESHRTYGLPMSLHLSGTLVESMLWHEPGLLRRMGELLDDGWCELLGGTYSEPIMPAISRSMNRAQLTAMREILAEHFPSVAESVRTAWLPERVWGPELVETLADPTLPDGPYTRVLVDDRLLGQPDESGPFHWRPRGTPPAYRPDMVDLAALRPATIVDGPHRLTVVPISAHLRYLFPPRTAEQYDFLGELLADVAARDDADDPVLLVYADDMERAAGVGGWEPAIAQYARLLDWLSHNEDVELVRLDSWLDAHPAREREPLGAGSYYELQVEWQAGADYRGWTRNPQWSPYARLLSTTEAELERADARLGLDGHARGPLALARRLLMLGQHETAWHDPVADCSDGSIRHVAPWVRATASHARLAAPLIAAADWAAENPPAARIELTDIDGDGDDELILANDEVWCLVSPSHGARLTMMCHRSVDYCALTVGNPADHWNFQEELHRFMDLPAAHPGALTDSRNPHEAWSVRLVSHRRDITVVDLYRNGDTDWGRRYGLIAGIPALVVCVRGIADGDAIDNLLTPDYLAALRHGRPAAAVTGRQFLGWSYENRSSWVGFDPRQAYAVVDGDAVAGHGHLARVRPCADQVEFLLGAGPVSDHQVRSWLAAGRAALLGERLEPDLGAVAANAPAHA